MSTLSPSPFPPKARVLLLLSAVVCSVMISYQSAWYVAEHVFFDQLIYGKSRLHGYAPFGNTYIEDFGERSRVVRTLYKKYPEQSVDAIKPPRDTYTIAIVGDSYVWGLGVRYKQTLSYLLEKKLERFRRVRVLPLGAMSDDVIDNYAKYKEITHLVHIDLTIFVPVDNDIVFNEYRRYRNDPFDALVDSCAAEGSPILTVSPLRPDYLDVLDDDGYPERIYHRAYASKANWCMVHNVARMYPVDNAIYFFPDAYEKNPNMQAYRKELLARGGYALSSLRGKDLPRYQWYWNTPSESFHISQKENHPSPLAHQMFADILAQEILHNPRWGFKAE